VMVYMMLICGAHDVHTLSYIGVHPSAASGRILVAVLVDLHIY
jgi:hypothetical protein